MVQIGSNFKGGCFCKPYSNLINAMKWLKHGDCMRCSVVLKDAIVIGLGTESLRL